MSADTDKPTDTLVSIEHRLQTSWHALVQADTAGQNQTILERLFAAYMIDMDAFLAARREPAATSCPVPNLQMRQIA